MKKSEQLKAKRDEVLKQANELTTDSMDDAARAKVDALTAEANKLSEDITRAEAVEAAVEAAESEPVGGDSEAGEELQSFLAGDTNSLSDTVLAELDRQILILMQKTNPMRQLAHSVTTSSGIYEKLVSTSDIEAEWVSETGARNPGETTSLEKVQITAGELFASVPYTKRVLDMSAFDLVGWAQAEVAKSFASKERRAMFVDGDGTDHKPVGMLTHVDTGIGVQRINSIPASGSTITADDLIDLTYELETEYQDGAVWVMSRQTAKGIRKLKDSEGRYIWTDGLSGNPSTLLGYPIHFVDEMPDVEPESLPIAFGNINQAYTIVNHTTGTRITRDEVTAKPNVLLDNSRYCGGDVVDGQAVKVLKMPEVA